MKCPKAFKPKCSGKAFAFTLQKKAGAGKGGPKAGKKAKAVTKRMTATAVASQKAGRWKVVKLKVLGRYEHQVAQMAKQPHKRLLSVMQQISAPKFKGGKQQKLIQKYRVKLASQ